MAKKISENTTKISEKTTKTLKKDDDSLVEVTLTYKNAMAREKLRKLQLQNDHQAFDLEKKRETICYRAVAISEFEKAVSSIYAQIKNADEQLSALLRLEPAQAEVLHDYMENILTELSNIDIELSTTSQFDAETYYDGRARKAQKLQTD